MFSVTPLGENFRRWVARVSGGIQAFVEAILGVHAALAGRCIGTILQVRIPVRSGFMHVFGGSEFVFTCRSLTDSIIEYNNKIALPTNLFDQFLERRFPDKPCRNADKWFPNSRCRLNFCVLFAVFAAIGRIRIARGASQRMASMPHCDSHLRNRWPTMSTFMRRMKVVLPKPYLQK